MAMCESESYPNPGTPCTPDSDANIKASPDSNSPDWVGNHAGAGFMELQFYPPGWVPRGRGLSCDATRWCAAMTVFGLSIGQTRANNEDCLERAGEEWADYAFITTDGIPQVPPDPLSATQTTYTPDPAKVLFMDAGDALNIGIHDSAAGLVIQIDDLTAGTSGSMTASVANGFAHPLFQPDATTCTEEPYAFHPMYSTSSETTNVPWAVHSYNVSFSDEIGHFQRCLVPERTGAYCRVPGRGQAPMSENECYRAAESLLVRIGGCRGEDLGFDGSSYLPGWSGASADVSVDRQLHSESFNVTSPLTDGQNYPRMAFESNLPGIEHQFYGCADDGTGCLNPPPGAQFYPIYSTHGDGTGACAWQEGGNHIPGTTNTFGGNSTAEYGAQLLRYYPQFAGFPERLVVDDYRNVLSSNPCTNTGSLPAS